MLAYAPKGQWSRPPDSHDDARRSTPPKKRKIPEGDDGESKAGGSHLVTKVKRFLTLHRTPSDLDPSTPRKRAKLEPSSGVTTKDRVPHKNLLPSWENTGINNLLALLADEREEKAKANNQLLRPAARPPQQRLKQASAVSCTCCTNGTSGGGLGALTVTTNNSLTSFERGREHLSNASQSGGASLSVPQSQSHNISSDAASAYASSLDSSFEGDEEDVEAELSSSFFQRFSLDGIKRSFRLKKNGRPKRTPNRRTRRELNSAGKRPPPCDGSNDSGLGEDSDLGIETATTRPSSTASPSSPPPLPILRSASGTNSSNNNGAESSVSKKHVMIREPSLKHLPSAARHSYPGVGLVPSYSSSSLPPPAPSSTAPRLVERVRYRPNRHSYSHATLLGDVGPQWGSLQFQAAEEVRRHLTDTADSLKHHRVHTLTDLIFSNHRRSTEDKLICMDTDEVEETIHLLYKILYHDWLGHVPVTSHLPMILHCVQKFLVIMVNVCPDLDPETRSRLSTSTGALVKYCEEIRFSRIRECLDRTRQSYIQVWCAILSIPFVNQSTSSAIMQKSHSFYS